MKAEYVLNKSEQKCENIATNWQMNEETGERVSTCRNLGVHYIKLPSRWFWTCTEELDAALTEWEDMKVCRELEAHKF